MQDFLQRPGAAVQETLQGAPTLTATRTNLDALRDAMRALPSRPRKAIRMHVAGFCEADQLTATGWTAHDAYALMDALRAHAGRSRSDPSHSR